MVAEQPSRRKTIERRRLNEAQPLSSIIDWVRNFSSADCPPDDADAISKRAGIRQGEPGSRHHRLFEWILLLFAEMWCGLTGLPWLRRFLVHRGARRSSAVFVVVAGGSLHDVTVRCVEPGRRDGDFVPAQVVYDVRAPQEGVAEDEGEAYHPGEWCGLMAKGQMRVLSGRRHGRPVDVDDGVLDRFLLSQRL